MEAKFLENFKEILEVEDRDLSLEDNFRDYPEWDSLANLSAIAMIDDEFGVVIDNNEFKKLNTLGELLAAIKSRMNS